MSSHRPTVPGRGIVSPGRSAPRYDSDAYNDYMRRMMEDMRRDYERRNRENQPGIVPGSGGGGFGGFGGGRAIEVDTLEFYVKDNAREHNTHMFELVEGNNPVPVLRRGQPFYLAIRFKRAFDSRQDKVKLELAFGPQPVMTKGTLVHLYATGSDEFSQDKKRWDVRQHHHESTVVTLQIQIPGTAMVGAWKLRIISQLQPHSAPVTYTYKDNIYILFNPWSKEDTVYMEKEDHRREYVLNDVGKIFIGSYTQPKGRQWIYGQFAAAVLPSCNFVLEKSGLDYTARGNAVRVARAISSMVNSEDDRGVVLGNWSGQYDDGTAPWMWTGSSSIMEQYLKSRGEPVKYGQCWVFAGVCATVCRALGLPCRTVTNYVSAHDTDDSLTVDKFFDDRGEEVADYNNDSIWNFHVWNDCWMARPDLPPGYGGWQTIDATPQETSEGVYRVGPASLEAVRRGEIGLSYDCPFVFSEVNADVIHWQRSDEDKSGWKKLNVNKYHVGRLLVAKKPGVDDDVGERDMEDITSQYKLMEGTDEERMAVLNAARLGGVGHVYDLPPPGKQDVTFDMLEIDRIPVGQPFSVTVRLENKSDQIRTVSAVLSASSVYYTGILGRKIKRQSGDFTLQPRQKEVLGIKITPEDYLEKLVDHALVKIYALATVKETQQTWSEEDDFVIEKPKLTIELPRSVQVGQDVTLTIRLTNPLNRPLHDCTFSIEGPGLTEARTTKFRDVKPGETIIHTETLTGQKSGIRKVVVVFNSRPLNDITGSAQIDVRG